jgi:hypothetical protein
MRGGRFSNRRVEEEVEAVRESWVKEPLDRLLFLRGDRST